MIFSKRKWGFYLTLWSAKKFKVKLLWFKSGHQCSMQRHFKRAEMWCVIFGSGKMVVAEGSAKVSQYLHQGYQMTIPVEVWHQFTAARRTLVLEVQTGECREDDIERANEK